MGTEVDDVEGRSKFERLPKFISGYGGVEVTGFNWTFPSGFLYWRSTCMPVIILHTHAHNTLLYST
jgi:hypothetical protein